MHAAIYGGSPSIQSDDRLGVVLAEPTDAVIRIVLPYVCGTDRKGRMGTWL
jgi:hypothetical protein